MLAIRKPIFLSEGSVTVYTNNPYFQTCITLITLMKYYINLALRLLTQTYQVFLISRISAII